MNTLHSRHPTSPKQQIYKDIEDPSQAVVEETSELMTGTIDSAVETTANITSDRGIRKKVQNAINFVKNRKWTSTLR